MFVYNNVYNQNGRVVNALDLRFNGHGSNPTSGSYILPPMKLQYGPQVKLAAMKLLALLHNAHIPLK